MKDYGRQNSEHISVGNWVITLILLFIPGINLIAGLCYLCGKKKSKRNYVLACIVLWLVFAVLAGGAALILYLAFKETYANLIQQAKDIWETVKDIIASGGGERFRLLFGGAV